MATVADNLTGVHTGVGIISDTNSFDASTDPWQVLRLIRVLNSPRCK